MAGNQPGQPLELVLTTADNFLERALTTVKTGSLAGVTEQVNRAEAIYLKVKQALQEQGPQDLVAKISMMLGVVYVVRASLKHIVATANYNAQTGLLTDDDRSRLESAVDNYISAYRAFTESTVLVDEVVEAFGLKKEQWWEQLFRLWADECLILAAESHMRGNLGISQSRASGFDKQKIRGSLNFLGTAKKWYTSIMDVYDKAAAEGIQLDASKYKELPEQKIRVIDNTIAIGSFGL